MKASIYNNILKETIERLEVFKKTLDPIDEAHLLSSTIRNRRSEKKGW